MVTQNADAVKANFKKEHKEANDKINELLADQNINPDEQIKQIKALLNKTAPNVVTYQDLKEYEKGASLGLVNTRIVDKTLVRNGEPLFSQDEKDIIIDKILQFGQPELKKAFINQITFRNNLAYLHEASPELSALNDLFKGLETLSRKAYTLDNEDEVETAQSLRQLSGHIKRELVKLELDDITPEEFKKNCLEKVNTIKDDYSHRNKLDNLFSLIAQGINALVQSLFGKNLTPPDSLKPDTVQKLSTLESSINSVNKYKKVVLDIKHTDDPGVAAELPESPSPK